MGGVGRFSEEVSRVQPRSAARVTADGGTGATLPTQSTGLQSAAGSLGVPDWAAGETAPIAGMPLPWRPLLLCVRGPGEAVGIEELEDKLLVRYRHMYVREINLRTRQTALVCRVRKDLKCKGCVDTRCKECLDTKQRVRRPYTDLSNPPHLGCPISGRFVPLQQDITFTTTQICVICGSIGGPGELAGVAGFEPAAVGFGDRCSTS